MSESEVDVERMGLELGVPAYRIRHALDLPLSPLERIIAEKVRHAKTKDELLRLCALINLASSVGCRSVRKLVKLSEGSLEETVHITHILPDHHPEIPAVYAAAIACASSREELLQLYPDLPYASPAKLECIRKMSESYLNDAGEADVERMTDDTGIYGFRIRCALNLPMGEEEQPLYEETKRAATRDALLEIIWTVENDSTTGRLAVQRLVKEFSPTWNDLWQLREQMSRYDPMMADVDRALLALARTKRLLRKLLNIAQPHSATENEVIKKLAEFFLKPKTEEPMTNP